MKLTREELQSNAWRVFFKEQGSTGLPKLVKDPEEVDVETGEIKFWLTEPVQVPIDLTPKKLDLTNLPETPSEELEIQSKLVTKIGSIIVLDHDGEEKFIKVLE